MGCSGQSRRGTKEVVSNALSGRVSQQYLMQLADGDSWLCVRRKRNKVVIRRTLKEMGKTPEHQAKSQTVFLYLSKFSAISSKSQRGVTLTHQRLLSSPPLQVVYANGANHKPTLQRQISIFKNKLDHGLLSIYTSCFPLGFHSQIESCLSLPLIP